MYQDTTGRLLNHSESFQVQKVASLLTEALSRRRLAPWIHGGLVSILAVRAFASARF
jgi:hypothetical protein